MDNPSDHLAWYAIHCKPHSEGSVLKQLQAKGLEGYLPLWHRPRQTTGVRQASRPYFPCYLFAHADLDVVGISALQYMPGVRHLVFVGGQPARVPAEAIERIRAELARQAEGLADAYGWSLVQGDVVRITGGPLAGLDAVFERSLSATERVRLLVNFLSKGAHVEVERQHIEKVRYKSMVAR